MTGPSYPAARAVANRIVARLAGKAVTHPDAADALQPDRTLVEEVISAAFWASLRREEGRAPKISLAFVSPGRVPQPLRFAERLSLTPEVLTRLAPAVERPGIHLGVWRDEGQRPGIWGTTHHVPTWCLVLEVVAPGLLVVKYRRPDPSTKFANIAVLEGAEVKFIEQRNAPPLDAPAVLTSLLTFYSSAGRDESDHVLVRIATSMRAHGRGGSLLVVPKDSDTWRQSIVHPVAYSVNPVFSGIAAARHDPDALRSVADALADTTAVDGATVISDHFELLAFGVKIMARDTRLRVERVLVTEPVEGSGEAVVEPSQLGNTRHLSAAQFVSDQKDAIALVASQDGRFTVFAWSAVAHMVHAHRLEALLL